MKCRHCSHNLEHTFLDLGFAPISNAFLTAKDLLKYEKYYPLKVKVCHFCWLVQTEDYIQANDLFDENYAYFSSNSSSWLEHIKLYSEKIIEDLELGLDSFVIEVASNDGYLLKNFQRRKIPCLGIEPTKNTADAAEKLRIPVLREFFCENLGKRLLKENRQADLIIGNNVYAHVPNINDFTRGLKAALKPNGIITLEFPHLMRLIEFNQFDTVYHEHFSYLSLHTASKIFEAYGLRIWNVEELPTHGGSIRIYGCHQESQRETIDPVRNLLEKEKKQGVNELPIYLSFQSKVDRLKNDLLEFLIAQKKLGKKFAAYGAAAKGSTILNYAGIKSDLISFVCDIATSKQNKFMPGSHIPIVSPNHLQNEPVDYVIILPWNIVTEVMLQNKQYQQENMSFLVTIPQLQIL